ncbi:hypothetical protein SEUCBS140593_006992 [Sporothrix eucalyptigena]|uniref:Uncharacterized protein n=1 Tax=Sporothrix eucalyptigena TaxID=1812306 RepID=A0ABP0CB22_9PEZI
MIVHLLDPTFGQVVTPVALNAAVRYGDFHVHPTQRELILAVQEAHVGQGADGVENTVAAVHVPSGKVVTVLKGADFYEHPQFSPGGKRICWMQWDHPDMLWTGTPLYMAEWVAEMGTPGERTLVSDQAGVERIC